MAFSYQQWADEALLQRFLTQQDKTAFEILEKRYRYQIQRLLKGIVKDEEVCKDLYQETLWRVLTSLQKAHYQEQGRYFQWLQRIAKNLAIDYYRRCNKQKPSYEKTSMVTLPEEQNELLEKLPTLIKRLPPEQQEVLVLRIYHGLSFKEIAQQCNISINTALGRMRYALRNLRKLLKDGVLYYKRGPKPKHYCTSTPS